MFADAPARVTLVGGFPGGLIFYTLDGSEPNLASALYTGPISLSSNAVVRAMSLSADLQRRVFTPPVTVTVVPTCLQTSVIGQGHIVVSPDWPVYPSNSVVTLWAIADGGYLFAGWAGDLTGNTNPATLTITAPRNIQARFAAWRALSLATARGGSATVDGRTTPSPSWYRDGTVLSLEALPEPGWVFLRWEGTVTSTNNPLELLMDQDHQVQVIFGTQVRKVIAGYGSIVLDPPEPIPYGATVQATAVPAPGCWFVGWTGIGAGQPNPFSFTVTNALPM